MNHPGSQGEQELQKKHNTSNSANSFYNSQVLDLLNREMQEFIEAQ